MQRSRFPSRSKSPQAAARVSGKSSSPTSAATSVNRPASLRYNRFRAPRKPTNRSRSPSLSKSAHALGCAPGAENSSSWTGANVGSPARCAPPDDAATRTTAPVMATARMDGRLVMENLRRRSGMAATGAAPQVCRARWAAANREASPLLPRGGGPSPLYALQVLVILVPEQPLERRLFVHKHEHVRDEAEPDAVPKERQRTVEQRGAGEGQPCAD